jgi:hypothetical protein
MAATEHIEVREQIRNERRQLTESLDELRGELSEATDVAGKLGGVLPLAVAGAAGAGFVFGGGIGATVRYFMRRSREN